MICFNIQSAHHSLTLFSGATGDVSVKVIISPTSTARKGEDFKGSDFTLDFKPGERTKSFSLTVDNDDIPELDETIIVKLVNPTAGASVAQGIGNNVSVIIQANDVVAGYVGFSLMSQALVVEEGETVYLKVVRTPPAAGMVTVDWLIQGRNVTKDFNETSGTLLFKEVCQYGISIWCGGYGDLIFILQHRVKTPPTYGHE